MADEPTGRAVPGDAPQPSDDTTDKSVRSEPLDLVEGDDVVIEQQNVGPGNELGGGEFPDRDTPPTEAAPGPEGVTRSRPGGDPHGASAEIGGRAEEIHDTESFADTYRRVPPEEAASGGGGGAGDAADDRS